MRVLILVLACVAVALADTTPQQIHISVTGDISEMSVMWLTHDDTTTSTVKFGTSPGTYTLSATGSAARYYFPDPLPFYESGSIHTVLLTGLKPATRYYYVVGDSSGGFSDQYNFSTADDSKWPIHIGTVGDIGHEVNSRLVLSSLEAADAADPFDLFVHPGDLSYANGNQTTWDVYGNLIQPLMSHIPYMTAPGNHEAISLFIPYNARFHMPSFNSGGEKNMYYSWNYRNIHFLALDSEQIDYDHVFNQYKFIISDLSAVNRTETPWVIAYWHTPWYSANTVHYDSGVPMRVEYETAFYEYGVDMVWNGHVHAYERTSRVFMDIPNENATEYRTVGMGGNHEGLYYHWVYPLPDWNVYKESNYGFGTFDVYNNTHGLWKMHRAINGTIGDEAWVVRDFPRPEKREAPRTKPIGTWVGNQ